MFHFSSNSKNLCRKSLIRNIRLLVSSRIIECPSSSLLTSKHKLCPTTYIVPSSSVLLHLDTVLARDVIWLIGVPVVIGPFVSIIPVQVKVQFVVKLFPPIQTSTSFSRLKSTDCTPTVMTEAKSPPRSMQLLFAASLVRVAVCTL